MPGSLVHDMFSVQSYTVVKSLLNPRCQRLVVTECTAEIVCFLFYFSKNESITKAEEFSYILGVHREASAKKYWLSLFGLLENSQRLVSNTETNAKSFEKQEQREWGAEPMPIKQTFTTAQGIK